MQLYLCYISSFINYIFVCYMFVYYYGCLTFYYNRCCACWKNITSHIGCQISLILKLLFFYMLNYKFKITYTSITQFINKKSIAQNTILCKVLFTFKHNRHLKSFENNFKNIRYPIDKHERSHNRYKYWKHLHSVTVVWRVAILRAKYKIWYDIKQYK